MTRKRLLLLSLAALLLTCTLAALAGRQGATARPLSAEPLFIDPEDPGAMQANMRYRQCQPHHWRYVMLKK